MGKHSEAFVAFDVAKKKHAVAVAEGGRTGEVRFLGDVENSPLPIERTIKRLTERYERKACPSPYATLPGRRRFELCARYRRLCATGKKLPIVVAAIAREMAAFLWAIGREVAPR